MRKRSKKSKVWKYVSSTELHNEIISTWLKCNKKYKNPQGTSTLAVHARIHGYIDDGPKQATYSKSGDYKIATSFSKTDLDEITAQLLTAPFSIVVTKEFVNLLTSLQPRYKFPSNTTVRTKIQNSKIVKKRELKDFIQKSIIRKATLTLDAWSSPVYRDYLAVTMHWIDENWSLRSALLALHDSWPLILVVVQSESSDGEKWCNLDDWWKETIGVCPVTSVAILFCAIPPRYLYYQKGRYDRIKSIEKKSDHKEIPDASKCNQECYPIETKN